MEKMIKIHVFFEKLSHFLLIFANWLNFFKIFFKTLDNTFLLYYKIKV